jgi:hypothetical protein
MAKKSPSTSRQRGSATSSGPSGSRPVSVPVDHRLEILDDDKRSEARLAERRPGGVTKPQPADHHIEPLACARSQSQLGKRDLGRREQIRHQVLFAKLDLENIHPEPRLPPPPQHKGTDRRRPVVEFFEQSGHRDTTPFRHMASAATAAAFAEGLSAL